MKTCSLSRAKRILGELADLALKGQPTIISYRGRLLILEEHEDSVASEFDELIQQGIDSKHIPLTNATWAGIRKRG